MNKENAIIIDGVKHTLVKIEEYHLPHCSDCSLNNSLCGYFFEPCKTFKERGGCHFEILNQE